MIRFVFNERKTAQAAAYLLSLHKGTLNYMVLIKLLYLADRESLVGTGTPITGDKMVSMPRGPVLSIVLDLINMGKKDPRDWYDYISEPENYKVSLQKESPENDELSKFEIGILDDINQKFGHLDQWQLQEYTHTLPEWEDPKGSSYPILPETLLQVSSIPSNEIKRISEQAEELWFLDSIKSG